MWLKLCYFGRMSFRTAWLVRMIMAVTTGMTYFILIFALSIFAFANSFLLLSRMDNDEVEYVIPGVGFWEALKFSYRTGLGDFNTDQFPTGTIHNPLIYAIWLASTFINLLVILNAVIAVVSDIFDKVYENMSQNLLKELVVLMAESELLISRKSLFKKKKYIVLIEKERGDGQQGGHESKIAVIKDFMELQLKRQEKLLGKMERNLGSYVDRKLTIKREELENFTEKRLDSVDQQLEILDLHHKLYRDLYQSLKDKTE